MKEKFYLVEGGRGLIGIPWLINYEWCGEICVFRLAGHAVYARVGNVRVLFGFLWGQGS